MSQLTWKGMNMRVKALVTAVLLTMLVFLGSGCCGWMRAGGGSAGIKKSSLVTSQRPQADTTCSYNNSLDNNTNQRLPAQEQLRLALK